HNPSFAAFAKICGAHGEKVVSSDKVEEALQKALDVDGPALVEIMTDAELV
ncbi:MAG: thiamine pyrophosphate-dependent enzyme, partial [Pseudomonadota bacterium]